MVRRPKNFKSGYKWSVASDSVAFYKYYDSKLGSVWQDAMQGAMWHRDGELESIERSRVCSAADWLEDERVSLELHKKLVQAKVVAQAFNRLLKEMRSPELSVDERVRAIEASGVVQHAPDLLGGMRDFVTSVRQAACLGPGGQPSPTDTL
ncbi:hypothetical protein HaLaN_24254 [Haematococcus lacustris]|uniref:Uncharacterized protein n=1 Tax=Haematococcus lacustris TaxID=44745 RepID=A0A699ZTY5_HAELA|nr:hypothetical protein HaLaN_24254 [Haematococcus lacustris]